MTRNLTENLRNHSFIRGLTEAQVSSLAAFTHETTFEENEVILVEGQRSSVFYLVIAGSVAVELRAPRYAICVQSLGPGKAFGWSALLEHQDTLFQVRARERTTALCLDGAALKSMCRTDPKLGVEVLQRALGLVAGRVKATEVRFAEMCGIRA